MRNELVRLSVAVLLVAISLPSLGRGQEPSGNAVEVKALVRQLKDKDEAVRLKAAKELGKLGRQAREAIPALTDALKDADADVRYVAKQALARVQEALASDAPRLRVLEEEIKALKDKLDSAEKVRDEQELRFKEKLDNLMRKLEDERDRVAKESDLAKVALAEAERRTAEGKVLQSAMKERETALLRRTEELRKLRDDLVAKEIMVKSLQDRNLQLENQVRKLVADTDRLKTDGGRVLPGRADPSSPPPNKVEGKIQRVDSEKGLIEINLGSDAGIAKDHTLEVFRLDPPTYLGRVRVIAVSARACVAQRVRGAVGARTTLKEGDQVVSSILGAPGEEDGAGKALPAKALHVAIVGVIDLEKKGHDDSANFIKLLRRQGMLIDAYTDLENGKVIGSITLTTDYLILGALPADEAMAKETARMQKAAEERGVQVVSVPRFLSITGFKTGAEAPKKEK